MQPFSIQCTTCRRSLRVMNPEAIGQIVSCPKCGSMVMVHAPAAWDPQAFSESASSVSKSSVVADQSAITPSRTAWSNPPPKPSSTPDPARLSVNHLEASSAAALAMLAHTPQSAKSPPVETVPVAKTAAAPETKTPWKNPPSAASVEAVSTPKNETVPVETDQPAHSPTVPVGQNLAAKFQSAIARIRLATSNSNASWPKWFLPAVGGTLLACVLIFAVRAVMHRNDGTPLREVAVNQPINPPNSESPTTSETPAAESQSIEAGRTNSPAENGLAGNSVEANRSEPPTTPMPTVAQFAPSADPATPANPRVAAPPTAPATVPDDKGPRVPTPAIDAPNLANTAEKTNPPAVDIPAANVRTLQRVAPHLVNVNARLSDALPGFDAHNLPLVDFLALVSRLSTVPITIDADALAAMGQSPNVPVQVHLEKTNVADLLESALEPLRLGYQVREGQLIVGSPPAEKLRQVKYAVGDLIGDDPQALQQLAKLVQRMIAPGSWQSSGGRATMNAKGGALVVEQDEPSHGEILTFCEKLRIARGLPQKSRLDPARFALISRSQAHKRCYSGQSPRTFTCPCHFPRWRSGWVARPEPRCWWITRRWRAQEMTTESECSIVVTKKPLSVVLDELLPPLDLTWRVIDDHTLFITTPQEAAARMDVEFYPVRELAADAAGHAFIGEIAGQVAPQLWGNLPEQGVMYFDAPGRTLVVRAPQRVQWQVETILTARRPQK